MVRFNFLFSLRKSQRDVFSGGKTDRIWKSYMYRIVEKKKLVRDADMFVVETPLIARKALPGQFVVVRADEYGERVPLTIADFDRENGTITLVVQKIGRSANFR